MTLIEALVLAPILAYLVSQFVFQAFFLTHLDWNHARGNNRSVWRAFLIVLVVSVRGNQEEVLPFLRSDNHGTVSWSLKIRDWSLGILFVAVLLLLVAKIAYELVQA